ncbi:unnamed protein product [Pylaiella littoralis]
MCFPLLFPGGAGDPFLRARTREVSTIDALTHPMKCADMPEEGVHEAPRYRFGSHRTFAYWCLIRISRVFVNRNTEAVHRPVEEVTTAHIRGLSGSATQVHRSHYRNRWVPDGGQLQARRGGWPPKEPYGVLDILRSRSPLARPPSSHAAYGA